MGSVGQDSSNPAAASKQRRIQIKNIAESVNKEDIENLISTFGNVQKFELNSDASEKSAIVVYETPEMAEAAREQLNNYGLNGSDLSVEFLNYSNNRQNGRQNKQRFPTNSNQGQVNGRGSGYPLRIMVPSELVGAIIGKKGATIRNITTQCKARVDVHGKENSGLLEKVISIYGQPENCSNACKEILNVMQQEASANNRGMIILKMLADDRYCGRIIGKEGKMIKKIREDTDTKITVSNMQEMMAIYPDRVITIRGNVDNMVKAEGAISIKLNECVERDMQATNVPMMMHPSMPGMPIMHPAAGNGMYNNNMRRPYGGGNVPPVMGGQNSYPTSFSAGNPHQQHQMNSHNAEMCQISVPNSIVGAIIGAGGSIIKQIMQDSNAHVTVEPKREDDPSNPNSERIVTIRGSADACWKASYFIFEKVKGEGMTGQDERLKTAIKIPKSMVGRVIGKSGKNVREIQRMTGASIKLPEDPMAQGDEVLVEVIGNFMATQGAHNRIRALISQGLQSLNGPTIPTGMRGSGGRRPIGPPLEPQQ